MTKKVNDCGRAEQIGVDEIELDAQGLANVLGIRALPEGEGIKIEINPNGFLHTLIRNLILSREQFNKQNAQKIVSPIFGGPPRVG